MAIQLRHESRKQNQFVQNAPVAKTNHSCGASNLPSLHGLHNISPSPNGQDSVLVRGWSNKTQRLVQIHEKRLSQTRGALNAPSIDKWSVPSRYDIYIYMYIWHLVQTDCKKIIQNHEQNSNIYIYTNT